MEFLQIEVVATLALLLGHFGIVVYNRLTTGVTRS